MSYPGTAFELTLHPWMRLNILSNRHVYTAVAVQRHMRYETFRMKSCKTDSEFVEIRQGAGLDHENRTVEYHNDLFVKWFS
jgi:hypothetical protein